MVRRVYESIEVRAPVQDVSSYWSSFENFPEVTRNVEGVRMTGQDASRRKVRGSLGVDFDARTTGMDPGRGIGRNGIDVTMNYADPPGGRICEVAADALSEREMREDLENFARVVERGELGGPGGQTPSS